ncbi:MAG: DUF512 domain-containing protein [Halanaerobiales bacterium]|nr:DUF512 domain-containing protein [Halanaerobiales bacterium]
MVYIKNIKKESTAAKIGLEAGDQLISINGKKIKDYIEYNDFISSYNFQMEVKKRNGSIKKYDIKRTYDEEMGIEFEGIVFDGLKKCTNKCIFCFIDQQPDNLRATLNLKDDDYRFSFLQGSYITLTNLDMIDFKKIVKYHMSPLNISIHTTDPELRKYMMKNPRAGNIIKDLDYLTENGIDFNAQIVLCPGINDGKKLDESIQSLAKYFPNILSLSVVPVGLTKYKNKKLRTYTSQEAENIVNQINNWQKILKDKYGENFLFASDEFYLMSKIDIPSYRSYNNFLQLENGVGLTRIFRDQYQKIKDDFIDSIKKKKNNEEYVLITSLLGKKAIKYIIDDINESLFNINIEIKIVENKFFGETITVTGLLTAQDIGERISGISAKNIIIPSITLNEKGLFLDQVSIDNFKNDFKNKNIFVCDNIKDIMEVLKGVDTNCSNSR